MTSFAARRFRTPVLTMQLKLLAVASPQWSNDQARPLARAKTRQNQSRLRPTSSSCHPATREVVAWSPRPICGTRHQRQKFLGSRRGKCFVIDVLVQIEHFGAFRVLADCTEKCCPGSGILKRLPGFVDRRNASTWKQNSRRSLRRRDLAANLLTQFGILLRRRPHQRHARVVNMKLPVRELGRNS